VKTLWAWLGRQTYRAGMRLFRIIGFRTRRTRALIVVGGEVLLVRNWLGSQSWTLPGGGQRSGETAMGSIRRELVEEVGIDLDEGFLRRLGTSARHSGRLVIEFETFWAVLEKQPAISVSRRELIGAAWFPVEDLPKPLSPLVEWALSRSGLLQ
jgi:8-oxo-dGTP pyrophosphatase MutT (NUDIX family)